MIGEVLGSYRVVSRLGAGGMGTVWLAEHQLLGSRAAIKLLLPEMSEQKRIVERFFDEARAATRIQDPGIITVHEIGWHGSSAYIVMEHLAGETLSARLARHGQLPLQMALRILQYCALAMAAAHTRGIVHRDLKPDNIFIVSDGAVPGGERTKILDFGIAKLIDDADASHSRTQTGMIMGTPAYMSPEQCRGAGSVDHRTDIYALGCVMFAMLIGHPPFVATTAGDLIASHLREEPAVPSSLRADVPAAVDELVRRCLAKSPDARYQSMTELVRAAAQISGENMSIETIPPMIAAAARTGSDTLTTDPPVPAAVNTTMRGATGETFSNARPWRGGIVVAVFAIAAIAGIAVVATRDRAARPSTAPSDAGTAAPAATIDAAQLAVPLPDAAPSVVVPPDAAAVAREPARTGSAKKPPRGATGRGSAPVDAGTAKPAAGSAGSAKAGSGSSYDPYEDR